MKAGTNKRRFLIASLIVLMILDVILLVGSIVVYFILAMDYTVPYNEEGSIDTSVILDENDFYSDNYLETSNEFIAMLINHIDATFNYSFSTTEPDLKMVGEYDIVAAVDVLDKTSHNTIYNYEEVLVQKTDLELDPSFSKSIFVDYAKYNSLIKRFINIYDLDSAESTLTVTMRIKIATDSDYNFKEAERHSELSFSVPLTEKTVAVSINSNRVSNSDFLKIQQNRNLTPLLIYALIFFFIAIFELFEIVHQIRKTRTSDEYFQIELKRIEKNFAAFLQPIASPYKTGKDQLVEVESLEDLLEIRDSLQTPVLMYISEKPMAAEFIIPADSKNIVYRFRFSPADLYEE